MFRVRVVRLSVASALASALASGAALAQDGAKPVEAPAARPAPAADAPKDAPRPSSEAPKVEEKIEVKGNRYRFKLANGSVIVGVLPNGLHWERLDFNGDYEDCKEKDEGAGVRIQWVMDMDGDVFLQRREMSEFKDLGALTEEQKLAIRERVLADKVRLLEEREKLAKAEAEKLGVKMDAPKGDAEAEAVAAAKAAEEREAAEAIRKGDELLKKFPPEHWSKMRLDEILQRQYVTGVFPSKDESEFIDGFKLWTAAVIRKKTREAEGEREKEAEKTGVKPVPAPASGTGK
jgi:hypothetical protein